MLGFLVGIKRFGNICSLKNKIEKDEHKINFDLKITASIILRNIDKIL